MAPVAESPNSAPLVIACGALANDIGAALTQSGIESGIEVKYLPARYHNRPEHIVPALRPLLAEAGDRKVFVAYADCGTSGDLDVLLAEYPGVTRLPGAHCFELFAGADRFAELQEEEPGTFYLTDFLANHFDALVWRMLGLDAHPELRSAYFGNYTRVVLLARDDDPTVREAAASAAELLELPLMVEVIGPRRLVDAIAVGLPERSAS